MGQQQPKEANTITRKYMAANRSTANHIKAQQ
jgi:hypothetical protein